MDIVVLSHSSKMVPNILEFAASDGALCLFNRAIAKGTDSKWDRPGFSHRLMLTLFLFVCLFVFDIGFLCLALAVLKLAL